MVVFVSYETGTAFVAQAPGPDTRQSIFVTPGPDVEDIESDPIELFADTWALSWKEIEAIAGNITRRGDYMKITLDRSFHASLTELVSTVVREDPGKGWRYRRVYRWAELEKFLRRFLREFVSHSASLHRQQDG